jgi:hypothetical protein
MGPGVVIAGADAVVALADEFFRLIVSGKEQAQGAKEHFQRFFGHALIIIHAGM